MIETIKIANIEIRSGTSKTGRGYSMPIVMDEDGRKLSMYIDKEYDVKTKNLEKVQAWKVGDQVEIEVEQNGDYLNFKLPSKVDLLSERVGLIEDDVKELREEVVEAEGRIIKIEDVIKKAQKKTE